MSEVKHKPQLIFNDAEGKEVGRRNKSRGRTPIGAVKQDNGDFVIPNCSLDDDGNVVLPGKVGPKAVVYKVELNEAGEVVSKVVKGRGRGPHGFVKQETGEWAGHWVKVHGAGAGESPSDAEVVEVTASSEEVEAAIDADTEELVGG